MSAIADILDRFRAAARAPIAGGLDQPVVPDDLLAPFIEATVELEQTARADAAPLSRSTLAEARDAWAAGEGSLGHVTSRHIRALCWDTDTATSPEFVRAMARRDDLAKNRRWLEGLVECYLAQWRAMPQPYALEDVIHRALARFTGRSDRLAKYKPVAKQLFSADAPKWMAQAIVSERRGIEETLEEWRLEQSSGLGEAVATATVQAWTDRFIIERRSLHSGMAFGAFRQLTQELLTSSLVAPAAIARAMSAMILWDRVEADDRLRQALIDFLLEDPRFRDPRLPNRNTIWDQCEPEARQRAIGWLAKGDLLFFFQFVIRRDPHGRRDFWLRYINRAVDAHVALFPDDAYRLRAEVKDKLSYAQIPGGQTSAFMMRFKGATGDILCIEFSEIGNALYIHDADRFNETFGGIRRSHYTIGQLKHFSNIDKYSHIGPWESKVQAFLARRGIRPA